MSAHGTGGRQRRGGKMTLLSEEGKNDSVVSELRMNITTLQKFDRTITDIVYTCKRVAQYQFSTQDHKWQKTERNGSLFVYKRSIFPYFGFFILNQLNQENVNELITGETEFECKKPFLMYRNESLAIFALWFSNGADCEQIWKISTTIKANGKYFELQQPDRSTKESQESKKQSDLSDPAIKKASVVRKSIPQMLKSEPVTIPEQSPLSRLFKRHGSQSLIQTNSETGDTEMDSMCSRDTVTFKDSITSIPSNQRFRSSTVPANLNQMVCKSDYNKLLSPKSGEIVNDLCSHIEYNNDGLTFEAIAHLTEDKKNSPGSEDLAVAEGDRNEESDAATEGINYPSLLMSPMVFQRSSVPSETLSDAATPPTQNFSSGIVLTKEQLKNTLIDLLQNDDKFLETINAAYLRHLARD